MLNIGPKAKGAAVLILCAAILSCLVLFSSPADAAESWMQDSLDKLVNWGVMNGFPDGQLHEYDPVTRAQFVAMVNRALGYTEVAETPFTDVPTSAWYAEDIAIAYNAGYFSGTSATTASPDATLTREQAVVLLSRNLRLAQSTGEVMEFSDGNSFGSWSKGYIKSAVTSGMINGYTDGTFRPQAKITRGEMAKVLTNALGTLVHTAEAQSLTGVYGNVTINTPNVTLRNTTIAGNLYLSGGVGLGGVTLENVKVLGDIVIIGGGESQNGGISIVLRNVEAEKLVVDSLSNQYTSLSVEGDSVIGSAEIRTNAFIQDRTAVGYGLKNIQLKGASGAVFSLAGTLKSITNLTPASILTISRGTVASLTVDESAVGSQLLLTNNASITELNLDCATPVSGNGDIGTLNATVNGCQTSMLPDKIVIRPGVTASIAGEEMDTAAGEESSADPRLLAGYPKAINVASTSLSAVFSANKAGTVYWAISSTSAGAVSEADLISPPATSTSILKSGNISITSSTTEFTAKITGLTMGGSYYLTAVLVDAHNWHSPVKTVTFTTPDDSTPAFGSGYPYMSRITSTDAQVTVLSTKSCQLYYAVMPKGSVTPTTAEFLAGPITGSLGYGVLTLTKNVSDSFTVNSTALTELGSYDLYLWLTDSDGAKSAAVKKISFTTVDGTAPVFQTELTANSIKATAIGFVANLNEAGTIYWVAVKEGTEYPKPASGSTDAVAWTSDYAKLQVYSGMNALKSGKTAAKANTDVSFTISGLDAEASYDIYYIAVDTAGNYCESIKKLTANTLDEFAPTATQQFTRYSGSDATVPYANTDIVITFSESVQRASTNQSLISLYRAVADAETDAEKATAKTALALALSNTMKLYSATGSGQPTLVSSRSSDSDTDWVIDYRNATVKLTDGKLNVTFATTDDESADSALNLSSGGTYYFQLEDIADTSSSKNLMGVTSLSRFTTISAQVALAKLNVTSATVDGSETTVDISFSLTPVSTSKVASDIDWDMLLWSDSSVSFELYRRTRTGSTVSAWEKVGGETSITTTSSTYVGRSLGKDFENLTAFPSLNSFAENTIYEYAVHFTALGGSADRDDWTQRVNMRVSVVSGSSVDLRNLATNITDSSFAEALNNDVDDIGTPESFTPYIQFMDTTAPSFTDGYPTFEVTDSKCSMNLLLDRAGTVYYAIAPVGVITTQTSSGTVTFTDVPTSGTGEMVLTKPGYLNIVNPTYTNSRIKTGSIDLGTGVVTRDIDSLEPGTEYYAYFVIKSTGQVYSSVYLYRFTTAEVTRPVITIDLANPVVSVKSNLTASANYMLVAHNISSMSSLLTQPFNDVVKAADLATLSSEYTADDFTVLNAMATNVVQGYDSIGSLFDIYAIQSAKDTIADYIRGITPSSLVVGNGNLTLPAGTRVSVDCSTMPMSAITQYCFLVVGRSESGSGDAFRAIYPITLVDETAPLVVDVQRTLSVDASGKISGTVTLVFNEDLYYLTPGSGTSPSTLQKIDLAPVTGVTRSSDFISIINLISSKSDSVTAVTNGEVNVKTSSIDINFNLSQSGSYIIFKTNLSDKYQNVRTNSLSVSVSTTKNADGTYTAPVVTITPAWDGR